MRSVKNFVSNIAGVYRSYRDDEKAATAMVFGLSATPLAILIGFTADFAGAQTSMTQVQNAVDSAVLAAAVEMQSTQKQSEIEKIARDYFESILTANGVNASCEDLEVTPDHVENTLTADVDCYYNTYVSAIAGIKKIDFHRTATTAYGVGKLDVAFMFDTSGSMGSQGRMGDLKKAAKEAVGIILASETEEPDDVRIAISTYATSVNVGTTYFEAVTNEEPNKSECKKYKKNGKKCKKWKQVSATCVTGREGSAKYTDDKPGTGKWIAYDTLSCNSASITPLTTDQDDLEDAIDALPTTGSTAGHLGIAWSWYLISPEWKSIWPSASEPMSYDEPDSTKVAVLMTDGEFNKDYMNGGGSDDHAKKFCDNMKDAGIVIYAVAFKAPSSGEKILDYCGGDSGGYFKASNGDQLTSAYKAIATSISDLRLAH